MKFDCSNSRGNTGLLNFHSRIRIYHYLWRLRLLLIAITIAAPVYGSHAAPGNATVENGHLASPLLTGLCDQLAQARGAAVFAATVRGAEPLSYRWLFNGNCINGACGPSLRLASVSTNDVGAYSLIVSNSFGTVTSQIARLTVNRPPAAWGFHSEVGGHQGLVLNAASPTNGFFDPDGDTVKIAGVDIPATNCGRVTFQFGQVAYFPPGNFIRPEQFSLRLSDGRGGEGTGIVTVFPGPASLPKNIVVSNALATTGGQGRVEGLGAYDVVVYGGVPCGVMSAVAAARQGAQVLLIEPTRHVGGLNASGINTAETEHMISWTIGGLALEFYRRLGSHYGTGEPEFYFESSAAERVFLDMLREAGVAVRFGAAVAGVEKSGNRIHRIALTDGSLVEAKVFVDASYEGDLMARAGVDYTWGRESVGEYGESLAGIRFGPSIEAQTVDANGNLLPGISGWTNGLIPGSADKKVMNYNYRMCFTSVTTNFIPIPPPTHYDRKQYRLLENWLAARSASGQSVVLTDILDLYGRRNGKIEVNNMQDATISLGDFGGQFAYPDADYAQRNDILADHWDYTLGLFYFLAHDLTCPDSLRSEMLGLGLAKDEFNDNGHLPYQLYVREARRMRGTYVMTQRDVQNQSARRKPDGIGMGSHFIDCHHVQRLAVSPTSFVNEGRIWISGLAYQIPYRALLPKREQCVNLLVPGAASFSHVAFCTYRVESTWMIAGHAAGLAGALAAQERKDVQAIDIEELQALLKRQGQVIDFIPGRPEQFQLYSKVEDNH